MARIVDHAPSANKPRSEDAIDAVLLHRSEVSDQILGIVGTIRHHDGDRVAANSSQSCANSHAESMPARVADESNAGVYRLSRLDNVRGLVGAGVVHDDVSYEISSRVSTSRRRWRITLILPASSLAGITTDNSKAPSSARSAELPSRDLAVYCCGNDFLDRPRHVICQLPVRIVASELRQVRDVADMVARPVCLHHGIL